ncbi:MAG: putative acyl-CoA dehydrogenase [Methylococcaceae bacterium NSP1-2]|nr:MAG: putative acyl-CoA dehydrogenase [Methylococcaceae bacterium NSP1-2]
MNTISANEHIVQVKQLIAVQLKPCVTAIDLQGDYPKAFLHSLGAIGGFAGTVAPAYGGNGLGFGHCIAVMEETAKVCLSSGFLIWCQTRVVILLAAIYRGCLIWGQGIFSLQAAP